MDALIWAAKLYLAGFIIKFCLMVSTAHVAAAVYARLARRAHNVTIFFWPAYAWMVFTVALISLVAWPMPLWRERAEFFRAYTHRETIRSSIASFQTGARSEHV